MDAVARSCGVASTTTCHSSSQRRTSTVPGASPGHLRHYRASRQCRRITAQASDQDGEKFISVSDVLSEAKRQGANLVFEDTDEAEVWDFESRIAAQPLDHDSLEKEPEVKGALRSDDADILSAYSTEQGFRETTVESLQKSLQSGGAFVLDVRTPQEYNAGHVPTAVNVPLDGLSDAVRAGRLDDFKSSPIAVICASGGRSAQATVRLSRVFDFPNVVNVVGGTSKWIEAGFPIERV